LSVKNLKTYFFTPQGVIKAVDGLDLDVNRGETVGLVGESGSGKSVTALSIMRLIRPPGKIMEGKIFFEDEDLLTKNEDYIARKIRGRKIAMCFQDPMTYLNPVMTVGEQIAEVIELHHEQSQKMTKSEIASIVIRTMELLGIHDAKERFHSYPHQLSGGMKQRILLAIALACNPELLIADEPTTSVDVITQAQILNLIKELIGKLKISVLFITHDLGIVAYLADKVAIMYSGKIMEYAEVNTIFRSLCNPYTSALLASVPKLGKKQKLEVIEGAVPSPINPPPGCRFHPRCPYAMEKCKVNEPELIALSKTHFVRCFLME
jgi:oligopeptide/dipeptide ABC transporter ATP-binding protein